MALIIILMGIVLDRLTKIWAVNTLSSGENIVVIKNFFSFSYLENRGAAFGILQNKQMFLMLLTIIVIVAMLYYLFKNKNMSLLNKISFSFIISGAVGNLIDRAYYKYVVDFILFHYKDVYYYPTFNVADVLVVVGTLLFAFCVVREER